MKRLGLTALGLAGVLSLAGEVLAAGVGEGGGYYHDGYMGYHHGWGMMGWMGPVMLIVLLVLVGVVLWSVLNAGGGRDHRRRGGDSALDVLRERYARGEIDHDEFEERKRRLE